MPSHPLLRHSNADASGFSKVCQLGGHLWDYYVSALSLSQVTASHFNIMDRIWKRMICENFSTFTDIKIYAIYIGHWEVFAFEQQMYKIMHNVQGVLK